MVTGEPALPLALLESEGTGKESPHMTSDFLTKQANKRTVGELATL